LVEEKHKEITDSINYAERIQRSFLATTEMLDQHLKDYFVFFRPKDVVSGDFYWAGELNNGNFAFSVADSTGHGVPGAIMSILNISSLEKSIEKETEPDKILNQTRKIIIERLKKDGSTEGGKDGMDCSLLVINKDRTQLSFASANNPVFIIRPIVIASKERTKQSVKNEQIAALPTVARNDGSFEFLEFKPDKMPVGKHDNDAESFTLHTALLQKGDVIYALTDGFPDQFGGDKGKKYMIKNLKELLLQIAHLPMLEQEQKLAEEFDKWKGSNEQVDDVCIIGVRI
jgi:serine phosphatase RsbU (regulator of sigma subunit)